MVGRGELTDKAWAQLAPLLPGNRQRGGRWRDHRMVINGILWKLRTGAPWRDLPERYSPWQTCYDRLVRWRRDGTWDRLLAHVQTKSDAVGELEWVVSVDSTSVQAHQTVRAGVDRLIAQGVLPGPQPSDDELLATLGVDLEAVHARLQATFGEDAYWKATQRVQHRAARPVTHTPHIHTDPSPIMCTRALHIAAQEAIARDQEVSPEHLLLGLLRDAEDPLGPTCRPSSDDNAPCWACPTTAPT